jgi:cobaltochelatase CobS
MATTIDPYAAGILQVILDAWNQKSYEDRRNKLKACITGLGKVVPLTYEAFEKPIVEALSASGTTVPKALRSFCDRNNRPELLMCIAGSIAFGAFGIHNSEQLESSISCLTRAIKGRAPCDNDRTGKPIFGQPINTKGWAKAIVDKIEVELTHHTLTTGQHIEIPPEMGGAITITTVEPTTETNAMTNTATATTEAVIAPGFADAINSLLKTATGGKVESITEVLESVGVLANANDRLAAATKAAEAEIISLKTRLSTAAVPTTGTVATVDAKTLTYSVTMQRAGDVFLDPKGKPTPGLDMMIPTFTWTDDSGTIVAHPNVATRHSEGGELDDHYRPDIKILVKMLLTLSNGNNVWGYGMPGTGKTQCVYYISQVLGWPVIRVNLDSSIEPFQLIGSTQIISDGAGGTITKFVEGIIPQALQMPCLILLDENDYGKSEVLYALQRPLEGQGKGMILPEDGGRVIKPNPYVRFIATGNTRGQGDEVGCFPGVRTQSSAYLNRFTSFIEFNYMGKVQEKKLLLDQAPGLPEDTAEALSIFALKVREAVVKGEILFFVTPRNLIPCAKYAVQLTPSASSPKEALLLAMEMTIFDAASNMDRQKLRQIADAVFK